MKTLKELQELRTAKVKQMETLVEERASNMDDETLATIKTLKEEIADIDKGIEAIEQMRSVAVQNSKPKQEVVKEGKEEFRALFVDYLRGKVDNATLEKRIMQAGTAGAGLETVPDEFYRQLQEKILEYGMLFSDANVFTTMDHGELQIPFVDDTGSAGAWTAEGGTITPEDMVTSQVTMKAYKCTTGVIVSTELLEDAFFDVESYVAGALGTRLARTFENAFINGDGTGKPQGIIGDAGTVDVPSAASGVVDDGDMTNAIYALTPALRVGASFYVSDSMMKVMDEWVDTTGRPLLQPQASATQAGEIIKTFKGYPVRLNFELGDATTASEVPVIFGNPSSYWIRNIRNITVKRSDELYALTDEVLFTATTRLDGKPVNPNPAFSKITVAV